MGNQSIKTATTTTFRIIHTKMPKTHTKCRGTNLSYPRNDKILRFPVPDNKVSWDTPYTGYKPVDYTADSVLSGPVWADIDVRKPRTPQPRWNTVDGKIDRQSHTGHYVIDEFGVPRNPVGRTGVRGRGCLGRWGPNHAADPIVTRWKRNEKFEVMKNTSNNKPVLQFVAIQRRDTGEWAIPGGMVDPGEQISVTLKREFGEEALNTLESSKDEKEDITRKLNELFCRGEEIYRGYVDDPRNTDNSWMETVAFNFNDDDGTSVGKFNLHAGDDAVGVKWTDINSEIKLYASHKNFIHETAKRLGADW
ncbi:unnamed protein product [Owenia fusiformis]|nr:unnamed protein product [Owenia fusiformis]